MPNIFVRFVFVWETWLWKKIEGNPRKLFFAERSNHEWSIRDWDYWGLPFVAPPCPVTLESLLCWDSLCVINNRKMKSIITENHFYLKDQLVLWNCLSLCLSHSDQKLDGQEGDSWSLLKTALSIKWRWGCFSLYHRLFVRVDICEAYLSTSGHSVLIIWLST